MRNISREIAEALADFGLEPGASSDQVKRRYLQLAAKWHPDKHPGDRIADQAMKRVNWAKEVLTSYGTVPEAAPSGGEVDVTHAVQSHHPQAPPSHRPQAQVPHIPQAHLPQVPQAPLSHHPQVGHFQGANSGRNTVYEIAQFTEHWILSALRAGTPNAEMPLRWVSYLIPQVEARWGVRLCATFHCFSRAMNKDLCNEHQPPVHYADAESDAPCQAENSDGMPCTNRALPGNHGFCGWHYGFGQRQH